MKISIKVPTTTANLGPGFDALGLALDLWNETVFDTDQAGIVIEGEGVDSLASNKENLIISSAQKLADIAGKPLPAFGMRCVNRIPLGSGMGSSAAAIVAGVLAGNILLDLKLSNQGLLDFAALIERHPDNVAPALLGGLVVSTMNEKKVIARRLPVQACVVTIVLPEFDFPTEKARLVLHQQVALKDAVHNISRAVLVTQAFALGDFELLSQVMEDALHQPYRLPLIPGAVEAMNAAREAGAASVALSGAGPSVAAFASKQDPAIGLSMKRAFLSAGLNSRVFELGVSEQGAQVQLF